MAVEMSKDHITIGGCPVPAGLLGKLDEASLDGDLWEQLQTFGYLLVRGLYDTDEVIGARHEVLHRLGQVGEVAEPFENGIATGYSRRAELHGDLGKFWRSVSEGPRLRRLINGERITAFMDKLFSAPTRPFDFAWLRAMTAGRASPLHLDHAYMNRGTDQLVTIWTPLGEIGLSQGPLFVVEGSHEWPELRTRFEGHDVDRDPMRPGYIEESAIDLAHQHATRLLTTQFNPGDGLIFGMFLAHGSFDNNSTGNAIRLSCDTRFQPMSEPMDERFCGPNPAAHGGKGYGCLSAAQPLTAPSPRR